MKIQNIYIDKYKVFNDFDIDFRNNKGNIQNLIVLAGINGTGKTTLLNEVIKGNTELSTDHGFEDYSKVFGEITINTNGINETHQLPALTKNLATVVNRKEYISNIVYFSSGNDISNIFNVQNLIIRFVDDLIYTKNYRSFDAYNEVKKKLDELFKEFNLQIQFSNLNESKFVFFSNLQGEKFPIFKLSGGEQQLISKLFSLYIGEYKNQVILIDEPEESLHPSWQHRIAPLYQKFADENNCQVILATHSPQIISSVSKDCLRILTKEDEKIKVISDFDGSYGWTVEHTLLGIMGVKNIRTPEIEHQLDLLNKMIHDNKHDTDEFHIKFSEMENILGTADNDLILMRIEIARKNKNVKI